MKKNNIDMNKVKYMSSGRAAFEKGLPRVPPETFVNGAKPGAIRLWFIGYDLAKWIAEEAGKHLTGDVQ